MKPTRHESWARFHFRGGEYVKMTRHANPSKARYSRKWWKRFTSKIRRRGVKDQDGPNS